MGMDSSRIAHKKILRSQQFRLNMIAWKVLVLALLFDASVAARSKNECKYDRSGGAAAYFGRPLKCFCGQSKARMNLNGFIVGGVEANKYSLPWQVYIVSNGFMCGGSIIGWKTVITAAHCITKGKDVQVWAGLHDRKDATSSTPQSPYLQTQTVPDSNVIVHPQYDSVTIANDIAVLKLSTKLTFNDGVRPICLLNPTRTYRPTASFIASGWGKMRGKRSTKLQQVILKFVTNDDCNKEMKKQYNDIRYHGQMCAKGAQTGGDTCQGDSGGPLITKAAGKRRPKPWILSGITSFGSSRCGGIGVYTDVAKYTKWIRSHSEDY